MRRAVNEYIPSPKLAGCQSMRPRLIRAGLGFYGALHLGRLPIPSRPVPSPSAILFTRAPKLEVDLGDVLEALLHFGLLEAGREACKCQLRQALPRLRIEQLAVGAYGVVMFTQVQRRPEPQAADGQLGLVGQVYPLRTHLGIGVRVVCPLVSAMLGKVTGVIGEPTTTELPSDTSFLAA